MIDKITMTMIDKITMTMIDKITMTMIDKMTMTMIAMCYSFSIVGTSPSDNEFVQPETMWSYIYRPTETSAPRGAWKRDFQDLEFTTYRQTKLQAIRRTVRFIGMLHF